MTPDVVRPARRRRRFVALALAAVAVTLLATFVLLEGLTRWLWDLPPAMAEFGQAGLYVQTPSGGTGLVPGYRGTLKLLLDAPDIHVEVNALGMRGPEVGDKQPGERRVLVVGDSVVFGYGVAAAETFVAGLETRLRRPERPVVVGNGGVSGFNSYEAARRLGDLRPGFAPDLVVFTVFLGNDAFENRNRDFFVAGGLRFTGPWAVLMRDSLRARLATRSRFLLWCETWLVTNAPQHSLVSRIVMSPEALALREGFPGVPPVWAETHAGLFGDVIDERTGWPAGAAAVVPRVQEDFRQALLAARAAAAGLPLLVLVLPTWWHVDADAHRQRLAELKFDPAAFRRGLAQQRLLALCTELGLPMLDATPWLEAEADRRGQFLPDGGHLTVAGHAVVAARLVAAVEAAWR